ncbi:MAG: cation:proton antiporter [Flavobacteriales bacterium]|nr:cation:proton antiporter [Flavobacteriales bacterium]
MAKNVRTFLFYGITLVVFGALIYWVIGMGNSLRPELAGLTMGNGTSWPQAWVDFKSTVGSNTHHALALLLVQILSIIVVARAVAYLFNKIGQPSVVGEIIAGIILGPSLLGLWFPETFAALFPAESLGNLNILSQIGLVLFMFVIGMELDLKVLSKRAHDAVVVSHASIIIPYALGVGLAYFIYREMAPASVPFLSFALFIGIAMSVTAFPVLARIIQERGMQRSRIGTVALTCAAADDVTAWCILAAVIAIVKAGSGMSVLFTILASVAYIIFMFLVLRPFLKRVGDIYSDRESISKPVVALLLMVLIASAWTTEIIGIHALFGAFVAGVIMPANLSFRKVMIGKLEDVSVTLLLPLFFVFTGLRTQIGLLNEGHLWWTCAAVIGVAVLGKFVGSAIAARFTGNNWRDSLTIGALMNTRGLMELVVLNIGYDLGVLSPEIFAILVLMALVTTFMTGPALDLINRFLPEKAEVVGTPVVTGEKGWRVLLSFGQAQSGRKLLRLADQLTFKHQGRLYLTALHLTPDTDVNPMDHGDFERESFRPIRKESELLGLDIRTVYKVSNDVAGEIVEMANTGGYDLLLVGAGKPLLRGTLLGELLGFTSRVIDPSKLIGTLTGKESLLPSNDQLDNKVRQFIDEVHGSVGIFIDKDLSLAENVLLPVFAPGDRFLFSYAERLIRNVEARVTVLDATGLTMREPGFHEEAQRLMQLAQGRFTILEHRTADKEFLDRYNFMLISYASWMQLAESRSVWLQHVPSTLILKP